MNDIKTEDFSAGQNPGITLRRYRFSRNARQWTVDSRVNRRCCPLNVALYHAGDIGRARAAARVLRIFRGSSSRKPDDEVICDVSRRPPTRRCVEFLFHKRCLGPRFNLP